jgi:flavin-dependent dehydrogenase
VVSSDRSVDVVVVGAGTAGAGTALQFARRGRSVVLVEQRAADSAGARWDNGVVRWHFERAGIEFPGTAGQRRRTVMVGPDGTSFVLTDNPVHDADMRALGAGLLDAARELGVEVIDHVRDVRVELRGGRARGLRCSTADDGALRIDAALVVDAGGRLGPVRRQVPVLARACPEVTPAGLCSAAQYEHRVVDPGGAAAFLAAHDAQPGDTVSFLGFAGGFSLISIAVGNDLHGVSVLTGTLGEREWGTGPSLMSWVRARHRWIGEPEYGGAGLIPLRRPYARFTAPGVALVGDAACQMFPAHGSGIGIGLVAGAMLAEATARVDDPGAEGPLWDYQARFQREHGGTLAAFDVVRRLSSRLGTPGVAEMFRSGLVGPDSTLAGLRQEWWSPAPSELPRLATGLAARPGLAARVLPALARASAAHRVYAGYPDAPDEAALRSWSRRADSVLGRGAI